MMSVELAIALRRRGLDSTVIALSEGGRLETRLADAGVRFEPLAGARYWSPKTQVMMVRTLRRLRPTAVHTHHLPSLLTAGAAARIAGVQRVVHTEHAFLYLDEEPQSRRQLRWAARTANTVALVGAALVPYYVHTVGIPASRLSVVPNGIDTERFRPPSPDEIRARRRAANLPDEGFLVGAVGRLAAVKNYGLLLHAAARARTEGVPLTIALVGDGEERDALGQLVRELDLDEQVKFLGWRSDVSELVGAFDVLAVTSTSEALPLVVLEAMAAGVAVVSTEVGEIPRVLGDGVAGLLVPSGDATALASALIRLAREADVRREMGRAGRARVCATYSHGVMTERYLGLYGLDRLTGLQE